MIDTNLKCVHSKQRVALSVASGPTTRERQFQEGQESYWRFLHLRSINDVSNAKMFPFYWMVHEGSNLSCMCADSAATSSTFLSVEAQYPSIVLGK